MKTPTEKQATDYAAANYPTAVVEPHPVIDETEGVVVLTFTDTRDDDGTTYKMTVFFNYYDEVDGDWE